MSSGRRVGVALLVIGALLAFGFAFVGGSTSSGSIDAAAATPLWSPRRLPQPFVEAVGAQHLQADLAKEFGDPGTCFVAAVDGAEIASHNPDLPVIGASTQKLLVAAATLSALGADFIYETKAVAPAAPDNGVVEQLVVVGAGDPVLATQAYRDFLTSQDKTRGDVTTSMEAFADAIVASGVKRIPGGILGDDSRYDAERSVASWKPSYRTDGDVGPLGALTVNDGFRSWEPRKVSVDDPAVHVASELTRLLQERGVTVGGTPGRGRPPEGAVTIGAVRSPPLTQVVGSLLRSSDNLSAELFTKELAVKAGQPGTTAAGVQAITAQLQKIGMPVEGITLIDGSGLDRGNRVTCRNLVAVLGASSQPGLESLWDGLPTAGVDGTLWDQLKGTSVQGKLRGKTGSLEGVSGLVGIVDLGRAVRFAFVDNGSFSETQGAALRSRAATVVGTFPKAPSTDELVPAPATAVTAAPS